MQVRVRTRLTPPLASTQQSTSCQFLRENKLKKTRRSDRSKHQLPQDLVLIPHLTLLSSSPFLLSPFGDE